jgi:hypothetical protein
MARTLTSIAKRLAKGDHIPARTIAPDKWQVTSPTGAMCIVTSKQIGTILDLADELMARKRG